MNDLMMSCFVETVRQGSMAKAAESLYFARQTVRRQIERAEAELGVALFERGGGRLILSSAGQFYFDLYQAILYEYERMKRDIKGLYAELETQVRIGCSEWVNPFGEIYDAVDAFRQQRAGLHVSMQVFSNDDLLDSLRQGRIDMALMTEGFFHAERDMVVTPLCRQEICIMGPADVVGEDLPREARERRREMEFLIVPGWNHSFTEIKVYCDQRLMGLDIPVKEVCLMPNFVSMHTAMMTLQYLCHQDRRFGFFNDISGLGAELRDDGIHLLALVMNDNEKKSVRRLIEHLVDRLQRI